MVEYGGSHGRQISEETRQKFSKAQSGKKWTEEHRLKYNKTLDEYAKINNGKRCNPETSTKHHNNMLGNTRGFKKGCSNPWNKGKKLPQWSGVNASRFGHHWSEEKKKQISESLKGRRLSEECKAKLSLASSNRSWFTNGIEERLFKNDVEIPEGWEKGRIKCTNA